MRIIIWLGCLLITAQAVAAPYVPPALEPWRQWVLEAHPELDCPIAGPDSKRLCQWPSQLELVIAPELGAFTLRATLYAPGWLKLPGDDSAWPQRVTINGEALAVQRLETRPAVYLPAGDVTVQGRWQWSAPPRTLAVPPEAGRISLLVDGNKVNTPRWTDDQSLLLQMERPADSAATESQSLAVYRLLEDGLPQTLTTQLQLTVSGRARALSLGPVLPPGFRAVALDSPLPAQLGSDGVLKLEARPGQWTFSVRAVRAQPATTLAASSAEHWPDNELWAFAAAPQVRTVRISGAPQVDAAETGLPDHWRNHPVYLLSEDAALQLEVVQRGAAEAAPRLRLDRNLWWDFNGGGATVKDIITGAPARLTRLEAESPLALGRAELNGEPLLITRRGPDDPAGLELRAGDLNLTAVSRIPPVQSLPVGGWQQSFESVSYRLQLPPGWSALHLAGPEQVQGTWLSQWNLWNIFSVLIIAVGLGRVVAPGVGGLALVSLICTYHRPGAPLLGWVILLGALALAPHIKGGGRRWLAAALGIGLIAVLLPLLPYSVASARALLYPQLQNVMPAPQYQQESADAESVIVSGMRASKMDYAAPSMERVAPAAPSYQARQDPNARIQAGPGLPEWRTDSVSAHWPGPVSVGETLRWWLAPPWLGRIGLALCLLLPWALLGWLGAKARPYLAEIRAGAALPSAATALLLMLNWAQAPTANAAEPDPALLKQLEARLTAPPPCAPHCANVVGVSINATPTDLSLSFTIHTAADAGVRLPVNTRAWQPQSVALQTGASPPLSQRDDGLWVSLAAGIHQLTLAGPAPAERLDLHFEAPPLNISHELTGWTLSGLQKGSHTLQLERAAASPDSLAVERSAIAPYAIITRRLQLNVEWQLTTEVLRIAPQSGTLALAVPLLPGEVPQTELTIVNGVARLQLSDGEHAVSWNSALPVASELSLTAADTAPWTERWEVRAGPIWHIDYDGPPPTHASPDLLVFQPEPGERLTMAVSRPRAEPGSALALDNVQVITRPGRDLTELDLNFTLRATYGGEIQLPLPAASEVLSVTLDGAELPAKREADNLRLALAPGTHRAEIKLRYPAGGRWLSSTPTLTLPAPAANIELAVQLPQGRWPLWVAGPRVGPEILFWSAVILVMALAALLARYRLTPLKWYQWALLSLGIATINIYLIALIIAWLAAFQWRGHWRALPAPRAFKLWQFGLAALGGLAVLALVMSIPYSLLAAPEMYITGNGSTAHYLSWYQDRVDATLPAAQVLSAPLFIYRLLMLAWSIWLAFALIRWIGWSWQQWRSGGFWPAPAPTPTPSPIPNNTAAPAAANITGPTSEQL